MSTNVRLTSAVCRRSHQLPHPGLQQTPPNDVPTLTCLWSLTCKCSTTSSFISRQSSIHPHSLTGRATPSPCRPVLPKKSRAIHNSIPIVQAAPPGLHIGNKVTLLKLHVKEEKRENTRPHPARSHRWEREAGGTRKNLPRGPRAPRSRARSHAVGRQPRAGPSEKPLGAAPIPKTQRKAAAPTQALKREVSPSDSQTLTASGEALPQSLLGLQ